MIIDTRLKCSPEFMAAVESNANQWVAACGGSEVWTRYGDGNEYLYCFNPERRIHGWLDRSDIIWLVLPANIDQNGSK